MAEDTSFSETGIIGTAAELFASVTKIGLRMALFPVMALKDLPFGLGGGIGRATASFPRAVGRAFDGFADEIAGITPKEDAVDLDRPGVHEYRNNKKDTAVVFVHGFGQNSQNTWGRFVDILAEDKKLEDWDIFLVGYTTNMMMDVAGLWAASPPIDRLAQFLNTITSSPPLDRYKSLALVAHSMGGLVTQRTLVDYAELRQRASHVIFYGTPSGGLKKAGFAAGWKRQIRDMAKDSSFITDLRSRWKTVMTEDPPFAFRVVAGDQDELVPTWSSLDPFHERFHTVVVGDHLAIVGPPTRAYEAYKSSGKMHLSVEVLVKHIMGEADPAGPLNAARLAVERSDFKKVIDQLGDKVAELDQSALVMLALAYDATGQEKKAIEIIEQRGDASTDLMGVLGGRFKRRWLLDRSQKDAERAIKLYTDALTRTEAADEPDQDQVYYHAINIAFMALAAENDKKKTEKYARKALAACAQTEESIWRSATEGEANLYLGNADEAVAGYEAALDKHPEPRQIMSMFQQAVGVAEIQRDDALAERLRAIFRETQD
ncbi:MAG: alpha/beta fold hydrolase [bacterium]|nr:alpha/beta fold hydrolase [bacterium]